MKYISFDIITVILYIAFLLPLIKAFFFKQGTKVLEEDIWSIEKNIAFIVEFFIALIITKNIVILRNFGFMGKYIPIAFMEFLDKSPRISYILILPVVLCVIYYIGIFILKVINYFTLGPFVSLLQRFYSRRGEFFKRVLSSIFALPRAICYIILLSFLLNWSTLFVFNEKLNSHLNESNLYVSIVDYVINPITNSSFAKSIPNILNDSFKIVEVDDSKNNATSEPNDSKNKNVIVYYNGVTLEQGIKSNKYINEEASNITNGISTEKEKAKALYNWIGRNINYDYDKANLIMRGDYSTSSGAIPTYESRQGICFDYSALYVAMARSANLKVRLVTGEGFNGTTWVSHAWNEVYIKEDKKWINVDATFYNGGNYFDSKNFKFDHREAQIAGEW